jgi:ribose 5-phosphate isomerase B
MKIAIGSDHAGFSYKQLLAEELSAKGHDIDDVGTFGPESVDYPDYALAVAEKVSAGTVERGILICGSAVGVCVVANKVPSVRAGICHDTYSARQCVEHDDVNVLCLGERVIGIELARAVVDSFLAAEFTGEPRHQRRLDKLNSVERRFLCADE